MTRFGALLVLALALVNWWSRWRDNRLVETLTKPAVTIGMVIAALVIDADSGGARTFVVAGLLACLIGDVVLLPAVDRFLVGLGAFAVGHALFAVAAIIIGVRPAGAGLAAAAGIPAVAIIGRRIAAASGKLQQAVTIYMALILGMGILVAGTGRPLASIGAASFVLSDTILGWNRFVRRLSFAPWAIMATYHLALACLVGMLS